MSSSEPVPAESSTRVKAGVLLVVTLLVGILLGAVGDRAILLHQHRMLPRQGLQFVTGRVVRVLTRELKLDDVQQKQVTAILETHHKRIGAVWAQVQPQVRAELAATDRDIEQILKPGQRPRFRELSNRWHARAGHLIGH